MKRDYIDFQDRSSAKAYLITFRTYGTWLHGDPRGSVDRRFTNRFGGPKIEPSVPLTEIEEAQRNAKQFVLGSAERGIVISAIREVCTFRDYALLALNVRTNHVHLVVGNNDNVESMMTTFKAYATRALKQSGLIGTDVRPWSRHGSTKYLWTDEHIAAAVDYVENGQGADLEFDRERK